MFCLNMTKMFLIAEEKAIYIARSVFLHKFSLSLSASKFSIKLQIIFTSSNLHTHGPAMILFP